MTSRKLIICLLASMVMPHISFLIVSKALGVALVMASPSSQ